MCDNIFSEIMLTDKFRHYLQMNCTLYYRSYIDLYILFFYMTYIYTYTTYIDYFTIY